jgi:hypothetical protein
MILSESFRSRLLELAGINDKVYYHGRNSNRPYFGKYIFITDSLGYASGYSDGNVIHKYKIPFANEKLFSIKNEEHINLLKQYIDDYTIERIIEDSGKNNEMDWAILGYISTDEYEDAEDLFQHLGFYGIRLKEREGVNSIYIFDQDTLEKIGSIDFSSVSSEIIQYYKDFAKDKNFL